MNDRIAYTLGHTKSYDQVLIDDPENCRKIGKTADYEGGWVWQTVADARKFLWSEDFLRVDWGDDIPRPPEKFSVYKILLPNGWELDTTTIPGRDGVHHLLVDSPFTNIGPEDE